MSLEALDAALTADAQTGDALKVNALGSIGVNPDERAKRLKLARETGVPAQLLDAEAMQAGKRNEFLRSLDGLADESPATAKTLGNQNMMDIAHDDIQNLKKFEQNASLLKKAGKYLSENVFTLPITQGALQYNKTVGGGYQWIGNTLLQPLIDLVATDDMKKKYGDSNWLTIWGQQLQEDAKLIQSQINQEHPLDPNSWTAAIRSGMTSTFQQLPLMATGGTLYKTAKEATAFTLGGMGAMTGATTYAEGKDRNLDDFQAGMAAVGTATVEIGTEMFPLGKFFELMKPGGKIMLAQVGQKVAQIYGGELAGESIATFMQDIIGKAYDKPNMTTAEVAESVSEYLTSGEALQNFLNTLKTTLVQTTVMAGTGAGINRVNQAVADHRQKKFEVDNKELLGALTSAEATMLLKRDPESFASFAQTVGDTHGVNSVYLQSDRIIEEMQKQGMSQEDVTTWAGQYGVTPAQLLNAIQTDGPVELEFGKAAANLTTDPLLTLFQNDLSIRPETSRGADVAEAQKESIVRINDLYQQNQENRIDNNDLDQWKKDLLGAPGLRGRVTDVHLENVAARANALYKLTGIPAIEHANRMLGPDGIKAMKFKDFQAAMQGRADSATIGEPDISSFILYVADQYDYADVVIDGFNAGRRKSNKSVLFPFLSDPTFTGKTPKDVAHAIKQKSLGKKLGATQMLLVESAEEWAKNQIESMQSSEITPEGTSLRNGVLYDAAGKELFQIETNDGKSIFSEDNVGIKAMYQGQQTDPLGALTTQDQQNIISLFEKADRSTFLHETGHIFLNDLKYVAENYGVQVDVWQNAKEWLGVGEDGVITRDMQERWAEHFEVYLKEGTAPVPSLKTAFRQFKSWLTSIYDSIQSSRSGQRDGITVTPELRDIFDRLLATEDEIKTAQEQSALIAMLDQKLLAESGFTPEQIEDYRRIAEAVEGSGRENLDTYKLKGFESRRKAFREQANDEASEIPLYGFIERLTSETITLDRESVRHLIGKESFDKLPSTVSKFITKDGTDVNVAIAEQGAQFGYEDAMSFLSDLIKSKTHTQWIAARVTQLETEHDMSGDTAEAIRTASLRKLLAMESEFLAKKAEKDITQATKRASALSPAVIKQWAMDVVAKAGVKQFSPGNIGKLLATSAKHRQQAIKLARKEDWPGALKSNEQARLNEELLLQTYRAQAEFKRMQTRWAKIAKWTNDNKSVKIGENFRDQINRLLNQYSIARKDHNPQAKDLHSFVLDMALADEDGMGTALPAWIGLEVADYKTLSWEDINDLNDALNFLYGHGRAEVEGLKADDGRFIAEIAGMITDSQQGMKRVTTISDAGKINKILRNIQSAYRRYFANTAILRFVAIRMDNNPKGPMGEAETLIQSIAKGMAASNARFEKLHAVLDPHLQVLFKRKKEIHNDLDRPEIFSEAKNNMHWTHEKVVVAALNMGNEDNLQRLMDGYGIDEQGIMAIQQSLTAEEWQSVQAIWNIVDTLWADIAETHRKINYFTPKKIQAKALTVNTKDGQEIVLAGGYYPIKYDPALDSEIAAWDEKSDILASNEAMLQTPVAKSGFAKNRTTGVTRPLNLSLSVLSTHLTDTIRYINLAIPVRDADRVFRNKELKERASETIGREMYQTIRPALKNVIRPEPNQNGLLEWGRQKMGTFYMAWNFWTAIQNVTGVFPAIRQVGMNNYLRGMTEVMKNPLYVHRTMLEASPYMKLREKNIERDIKGSLNKFDLQGIEIKGKRYSFADVQDWGWAMIRLIDTTVSLPAWWGKYNSEIEKNGGNISKARDAADAAVNKALGSGLSIDATGWQRHKVASFFAPFMSFASTQQEVQATDYRAWKDGRMTTGDYLYNTMLVLVLPAMFSTFLQGALMYGLVSALGGGDDERRKKKAMDYLTDIISYRMMGLPFARDITSSLISGMENKAPITSARIPVAEPLKMLMQFGQNFGSFMDDADAEKRQKKIAWSLAELASLSSGIPASRMYDRWMKGQKQIESGEGWFANHFIPQEKVNK